MKTFLSVIFFCVLFAIGTQWAEAQPDYYFIKTYGGYVGDNGLRKTIEVLEENGDTNYVSVGGNGDVVLMKTNANGNLIWSKTYGGSGSDIGNSVKRTTDGGYIIVGTTWSFVQGFTPCALLVIKTDSLGNLQWSRSYQGNGTTGVNYSEGYDVEVLSNGYIIVGGTSAFSGLTVAPSSTTSFVIKLDLNGAMCWSKIYLTWERCITIQKTDDGGFVFASAGFLLTKIDSTGLPVWAYSYYGGDYCNQMIPTSDGGYLMIGKTEAFGAISTDIYVVKVDSVGCLQWSRKVGSSTVNYESALGVFQDIDGGYLITGVSADGTTDKIINLKIDSTGNLIWSKFIESNILSYTRGYCFLVVSGGYLVSGVLGGSIAIIKVDTLGNPKCNGNTALVTSVSVLTQATIQTVSVVDVTNYVVVNYPGSNMVIGSGLTETVICQTFFPIANIKVEKILSPANSLPAGTILCPSFRVKNIGTDTIFDFDFQYSYTGEITGTQIIPVTKFSLLENWNDTLLPNQQIDIIFNEPLSILVGNADFCVYVELVGDIDTTNNSLCLTVEGTTIGIEESSINPPKIYPNPASDYIYVSDAKGENFILFNSLGDIVFTQRILDENNKIQLLLPKGIYLYILGQHKGKILKI